eukprot:Gregarina_sp_Poly_1__8597@NODE_50_length_17596_cov_118_903303_g43_i0_p3_GENE_NODE_50_length_17596_cov_118_903303_g43_i0NODE_50_length_17596_cov_118_903303_g43_i0_p3_ORF_typecomplete_len527_score77_66KAR9/PF08580_10/0_66_NODE_50_length_17596_cov_118_903303_g43_i01387815458
MQCQGAANGQVVKLHHKGAFRLPRMTPTTHQSPTTETAEYKGDFDNRVSGTPATLSALTTTSSEHAAVTSPPETQTAETTSPFPPSASPPSAPSRTRRRLEVSLAAACKRSRLVSPPRGDAEAAAHPFRQHHPGWPSLKELPEASWSQHHFRSPSEFAQLVDQDPRPPVLLAAKIYARRNLPLLLCHAHSYSPGENSQIFHGALKAALRDHLREEFARVGSFEYRKIAGYEEVLMKMAETYWLLFGGWPLLLQRRHLYSLPTWLTLMVPCYYEWRNASGRWSPKSRMPQAPSAKRFFAQYPAVAQMRWTLGRDTDCALHLQPASLGETHSELPVFRKLLALRQSLSLVSPLRSIHDPPPPVNPALLEPEVKSYLELLGIFRTETTVADAQVTGDTGTWDTPHGDTIIRDATVGDTGVYDSSVLQELIPYCSSICNLSLVLRSLVHSLSSLRDIADHVLPILNTLVKDATVEPKHEVLEGTCEGHDDPIVSILSEVPNCTAHQNQNSSTTTTALVKFSNESLKIRPF